MEWFKKLQQKHYISKIYKQQGSKGLQKLINLSLKEIAKDDTNNLSQDEAIQVSKILSRAMTN